MFGFLVNSIGLSLIIEKSKKCLDFTITTITLHLILTVIYNKDFGALASWGWWITNVGGMIVMVCLGE